MFYINNAFLHLELQKCEQISLSRGKHIKNTCCPICRQARCRLFLPNQVLYRKVATLPGQHCRRSLKLRDPSMVMIVGVRAGFSRLLQTGGVRTRWVSTRVEGRRQLSQPTIGGHRRVPVLQKSKRATCDQTDQRETNPKKDQGGERKRVRGLSW